MGHDTRAERCMIVLYLFWHFDILKCICIAERKPAATLALVWLLLEEKRGLEDQTFSVYIERSRK
jgi:hypothetical protein